MPGGRGCRVGNALRQMPPENPHALRAFAKPEHGTVDPVLAVEPQEGAPGDKGNAGFQKQAVLVPVGNDGKRHGRASAKIYGATLVREQCQPHCGHSPTHGTQPEGANPLDRGWGQKPPGAGPTPEAPQRGRPAQRPDHVGVLYRRAQKSFEAGC